MSWIRFLVCGVALAAASGAMAQTSVPEGELDREIAQRHFEAGVAHYEERQYARALGEFEAARRAKPSPAFDFNIGRCYDRMDQPEAAIREYERYLSNVPPPEDAESVRERIGVLRARLAAPRPQRPPGPPPAAGPEPAATALTAHAEPTPPPKRHRTAVAVAVSVSIAAAAALALGLGFGLSTSSPALTASPFPVIRGTP